MEAPTLQRPAGGKVAKEQIEQCWPLKEQAIQIQICSEAHGGAEEDLRRLAKWAVSGDSED